MQKTATASTARLAKTDGYATTESMSGTAAMGIVGATGIGVMTAVIKSGEQTRQSCNPPSYPVHTSKPTTMVTPTHERKPTVMVTPPVQSMPITTAHPPLSAGDRKKIERPHVFVPAAPMQGLWQMFRSKGGSGEDGPTIKGRIKEAQLPNEGRIRYIPPKGYTPTRELPNVKFGKVKGYKDKFGNIWKPGESRTVGEAFEWDVQLSESGKQQFKWLIGDKDHINVSLKGHITHR